MDDEITFAACLLAHGMPKPYKYWDYKLECMEWYETVFSGEYESTFYPWYRRYALWLQGKRNGK